MVDIAPRLASLASRPPTPPKARIQSNAKQLHVGDQFLQIAHQVLLDTPDESPSSSAEYIGASSQGPPKRVGFSPWTKYHKHPSSVSFGFENQMRILPPSKDCKSSKSILKVSIGTGSPDSMGELPTLDQNSGVSVLLESATQHLASQSRNSRIDAYTALLGCLSAYDDVPDVHKLAERLPDLAKFFRRDILAKNDETGSLDTHLVVQALKLLTFFVSTTGILEHIPDDFCSFTMEQSITSLEDESVPKIVITHYMLLLAKQNLASKYLSSERANKLITALDGVSNIVKGNRVVGQRLMLYRRLLTNARPLMIARVGSWIHHLITGMLSTIRDIRSWAIYFGLEASLSLGTIKSVSQACVDMFNRVSPEGKRVVDCLASRLTEMTKTKHDAVHVPQIWVVVIFFLRSRRQQLEGWEDLKSWLLILQNCFNSSDTHVKFQANIAWNRLIYAINLNPSTSPVMVKMLRQPIASQLDRKSNQKVSKNAKQAARSSYCTLLYYAFRPSSTNAQLDLYWEEYISQLIPCDRWTSSPDIDYTCTILAALLDNSQTKVWDENRANLNELVNPDDLPCLDPKWVRLRSGRILKVFENLLSVADWQPRKDQEAPLVLAWRSLTGALGEAGKMEVKVSMETMAAVAQLVNTIKRFWQQGLKQNEVAEAQDLSTLIDHFEQLILEAVARIGPIPFTEKRLIQSSQDLFEVAETPSTRSLRSQGPLSSPISSLLNLLVSSVADSQISDQFASTVSKLIQLALRSATSRRTHLAVLRELVSSTSFEGLSSKAKLSLWQLVAQAAGTVLNSPKANEKIGDSPQDVGHEYRDVSKILEVAIRHGFTDGVRTWIDLGTDLAHNLAKEIGNEAITTILIEPVAATIHQSKGLDFYEFYLASALFLLKLATWPHSRQALERARKMLWGLGSIPQKQANLDPFDHLYSMTNTMLINSYSRLQSTSSRTMVDFLSTVSLLISSCPLSLKSNILKQLQPGLAIWIEDAEGRLNSSGPTGDLREAVIHLWTVIVASIETLPRIDSRLLLLLESLIVSSLKSRQKAVVNAAIQMWNRTFGAAEYLDYSEALRRVLLKLRQLTDLSLPAFPDRNDSEVRRMILIQKVMNVADNLQVSSSPLNFVDTQIDQDQMSRNQQSTPEFSSKAARMFRSDDVTGTRTESPSRTSKSLDQRLLQQSPKEQQPKSTPKARLRHDNSQIQFAAIESSPLASEIPDSQMLTDRQREVRERQTLEAGVMFPGLRSTPKPKIREGDEVLPKLILKGTQAARTELNPDDCCPMLPPVDDILDDVFGSSPTPRSSRQNSYQRSSSIGSPSSPLREAQPEAKPCDEPPLPYNRLAEGEVEVQGEKLDIDGSTSEIHTRANATALKTSDSLDELPGEKGVDPFPAPILGNFLANSSDQEMTDIDPTSDFDLFVDAPSDPLPTTEADVQGQHVEMSTNPAQSHEIFESSGSSISHEVLSGPVTSSAPGDVLDCNKSNMMTTNEDVSRLMDSFQESERSYLPSEDEQIAAQLVSDLERASSQAEAEMKVNASTIRQSGQACKKRKIPIEKLGPNKKIHTSPKPQTFQVVVESRRPEDAYVDCVFVGEDEHSPSSPSPHRVSSGSVRKSTRSKHRTGSARSSTASNNSGQNSQASCEKGDPLPTKPELESESPSRYAASLDISSQRRSAIFRHSSVERLHAQNSPSARHNEVDEAFQSTQAARCSGGELGQKSSKIKETERELVADGPLEPHASCGNIVLDTAIVCDEGSIPPDRGVEIHDLATQTHQGQTEIAKAASPSRTIGLALGGGHTLSTSDGLDTTQAVAPDVLATTQQIEHAMQPEPQATAPGILAAFKCLLGDLGHVQINAEEEREMIGALFECVREVHEAGRRSTER
ncbi:hypothetical protein MMC07_001594 [Pseudocyphellaria aurata]|nr:hypothetical protein [Pseudocyphellaria aurata]